MKKIVKKLKNQGYNNINYSLKTSKSKYLIRVFKNNETKTNKKFEFLVHKKAFKKGIASKPLYLCKNEDFMVCEFIKAKHKEKLNFKDLKRLAKSIKKLHSIKIDYTNSKHNEKHVLCHHDLNPKNILFSKKDIKFIDWEYARFNDAFFDLATICYEFKLNKKQKEYFVKNYFNKKSKDNLSKKYRKKLNKYILKYKKLCDTWFLNFKTNKEIDDTKI